MKKYLGILFSLLFAFSFVLSPNLSYAQIGDEDPDSSNTEECISLENNLRYRDRDSTKNGEVSLLQDFLQSKGYLNSEPTGYFGILTFKAVKDFQRDNGINPTGYVGSITRAKIVNLTCTLADPLTPVNPPNPDFPPGCTSNLGYSMTTGLPCSGQNTLTSSITVLSPNGGETFTAGQEIEVRWKTENVPANSIITVYLLATNTPTGGYSYESYQMVPQNRVFPKYLPIENNSFTQNDGIEIYKIRSDVRYSDTVGYKIQVAVITDAHGSQNAPSLAKDTSDNFFTINANAPTTNLELGDVNGDGKIDCTDVTWISETVLLNRTLTAEQKKRADMNGDGNVTTLDGVLLSQRYGLNCGTTVVTPTDSDNSPDYSLLGAVSDITPQKYPDLFVKGVAKGIYSGCSGPGCPVSYIWGTEPNPNEGKPTTDNYSTFYDHCVGSNQLNEAYVIKNEKKIGANAFTPPSGYTCLNGAFVPTTATPSITVLSPNGGELYTRGETSQTGDFLTWSIKVVGVSSGGDTVYTLKNVNGNNVYFGGNGGFILNNPITATGSSQLNNNVVPIGKYYFVAKWTGSDGLVLEDQSDNYFTVTSKGDVNGDGSINCTDVTWIQERVLNTRTLTDAQNWRADLNGDNSITTADITKLIQTYGLNCGTSVPQIQILSIIGNRPNYSTDSTETIELAIKTTDGKGLPALSQNGYYIQAYIYKANDTNFFQYLEPNPPYSYNGIYNSATELWEVTMKPPSTIGSYNLKVSLYCSNTNLCDRNTIQSVKILPFTITSIIFQLGDVNGDGSINCTDVTWIQETVLNTRTLTTAQRARADVNGDGLVTTADITKLIQLHGLSCGNTTPSITVLSPNGGEVYQAGQQITVKWKTENIPAGFLSSIVLDDHRVPNSIGGAILASNLLVNDGIETVTLPTNNTWTNMSYGTYFKIRVAFAETGLVSGYFAYMDESDNFFTINAPTNTALDSTPRIAYWGGKVGQHTDSQGNWISDPDGTSGVVETDAGRLTYCKKWFGNTTSVVPYKTETITTWKRSIYYEQGNYTNTVMTYKCIEAFGYNTPNNSKLSSILGSSLQANALGAVNNTNTNQTASQIAPKALSLTTCGKFTKILMKGMNDTEVKCLQQKLNEKGYKVEGTEGGKETTLFGWSTLIAVKAFQSSNGLVADGIFGLKTFEALN